MNSGLPVCICSDLEPFPDLKFTIDGINYYLPKENYVFEDAGLCTLGVMADEYMDIWILGLNFFENYYTVFDQELKRIGFAPSINSKQKLFDLIDND